jgi:hypothetical protein
MPTRPESVPDPVAPSPLRRLWAWLREERIRYVFAWLLALGVAAASMAMAWFIFNEPRRNDGNEGHTYIDFGGQWLMGRMLLDGHGRQLYYRPRQRELLRAAYPREDEIPFDQMTPEEQRDRPHDAEGLMTSFMGEGNDHPERIAALAAPLAAVDGLQAAALLIAGDSQRDADQLEAAAADRGGPLYPPTNALVVLPLSLLPPRTAYRCSQVVELVLGFVSGLGIAVLSRGRVWWPVASAAVMVFPGFGVAVQLGQNSPLSLAILVWGWVLLTHGRPGWGGVVWGLFAFKPVWAAAFFLVPLLSRRWRACLTMLATGTLFAAATLPLVGWHSWLDWCRVGREAAYTYTYDVNWIRMSRDLLSLPLRWLDFTPTLTAAERRDPVLMAAGWCLLLTGLAATVAVAVLRRRRVQAPVGPGPAFLLLGAWLGCYHFMYYDVLLAALPVALLFTEPRRYLEPMLVAVIPLVAGRLPAGLRRYYQPALARACPPPGPLVRAGPHVWVLNRFVPTVTVVLVVLENLALPRDFPFATIGLILLWGWCGWQLLRAPDGEPAADVVDIATPRRSVGVAHASAKHR